MTCHLPPASLHHWHVWVCVLGGYVRVDSWYLFVFTSKEPWIQEGEDSDGRRAELPFSKDFLPLHLHFGFHRQPFHLLLQSVRHIA